MEADGRIQHPTELRAFLDPLRICTSIFWLCLSPRNTIQKLGIWVVLKQCLLGGFMLVVDYSRKLLWKRWSFANRPEISWNSNIVNHQPYPTNWPLTFVPLSTSTEVAHFSITAGDIPNESPPAWGMSPTALHTRQPGQSTSSHWHPSEIEWCTMVYLMFCTELVMMNSWFNGLCYKDTSESHKKHLKKNTSAHLVQCLKNKTVPFWPDHKVSCKDSNSTYRSYKL